MYVCTCTRPCLPFFYLVHLDGPVDEPREPERRSKADGAREEEDAQGDNGHVAEVEQVGGEEVRLWCVCVCLVWGVCCSFFPGDRGWLGIYIHIRIVHLSQTNFVPGRCA